jgi:hypothetical protein
MLICRVEFREFRCLIDIEYRCESMKTVNLLYSKVSGRWPYDVYCNYSNASDILKQWNVHECEIRSFLDELRDPDQLNEIHCSIQHAFTIHS